MDTLRAFLMWLGIAFHGSRVYDSKQSWRVADGSTAEFFDILGAVIHTFRMPGFFVIAGFFCWMGLSKMRSGRFIGRQLVRLVVPLIVVALSLNMMQSWFLSQINDVDWHIHAYWIEGMWVSHLWFLVDLVIFYLLAYGLFLVYSAHHQQLKRWLKIKTFMIVLTLIALLYPVLLSFTFSRMPGLNIALFNAINLESVLFYFPYFIVGVLIYRYKSLFLLCSNYFYSSLLLAIFLAALQVYASNHQEGLPFKVLNKWTDFFAPFAYSLFLFNFMFRFANFQNTFIRKFSEASYTTYLFHHLLVIVLAHYLTFLTVSVYVKYIGLLVIVTIASLVIHHLVLKSSPLLLFLFNGDRKALAAIKKSHRDKGK